MCERADEDGEQQPCIIRIFYSVKKLVFLFRSKAAELPPQQTYSKSEEDDELAALVLRRLSNRQDFN